MTRKKDKGKDLGKTKMVGIQLRDSDRASKSHGTEDQENSLLEQGRLHGFGMWTPSSPLT